MDNTADGRFAPFIEAATPIPGEHMEDTMIRDQIRRCELQLERPLTNEQKEVIRSYYQDMSQRRAPDEASQPTTIYSLSEKPLVPSESSRASIDNDSDINNTYNAERQSLPCDSRSTFPVTETSMEKYFHGIARKLGDSIEALEKKLKKAADQRIADRCIFDSACINIGQLQQQKHAVEQKLMRVASELLAAKNDLDQLKASVTGNGAEQTHEVAHPLHNRLPRAGGFTLMTLASAMVMLVWLVAEAMLHSKRLSDGFGLYINGGYNGLGSVLIFGSWSKFLMFNAMALYLGYFSVRGAMN